MSIVLDIQRQEETGRVPFLLPSDVDVDTATTILMLLLHPLPVQAAPDTKVTVLTSERVEIASSVRLRPTGDGKFMGGGPTGQKFFYTFSKGRDAHQRYSMSDFRLLLWQLGLCREALSVLTDVFDPVNSTVDVLYDA